MKVIKNEKIVEYLLKNKESLKDDDNRLLANFYHTYAVAKFGLAKAEEWKPFLSDMAKGSIPSFKTVVRTRRALQEKHKELRGDNWNKRHGKEQEEAIQSVMNFKEK